MKDVPPFYFNDLQEAFAWYRYNVNSYLYGHDKLTCYISARYSIRSQKSGIGSKDKTLEYLKGVKQ